MARSPLFSTYRQGENRVTSSVLAVLERLDIELVERLLSAAAGEATLSMLTFRNQSSKGSDSIPDAVISASFRFIFEVKTVRDALRADQLSSHLSQLDHTHDNELMFVLTPDPVQPSLISELDDDRIHWFNFVDLDRAIEDLLEDPDEPLNEQSRFLLRELRRLFEEDGLLSWDDTVIVAARRAYDEYLKYSAYICQPGRSFKTGLSHLGFYRSGKIEVQIPEIFHVEEVQIEESATGPAAALVERLIADQARPIGETFQVFLLSAPDGPETLILNEPILNTTLSASGRPWAWTLGQRYTALEKLRRNPATTGELDEMR